MVVYWRRMKATAPSKIVPATSCIACGALVPRQHVARQVDGEQDRDDARDRDEPQERVGHQGLQCLLRGIRNTVRCAGTPRRGPGSGERAARVTTGGQSPAGLGTQGNPRVGSRECMRGRSRGSNRAGTGPRRPRRGRPSLYSPLVDRRPSFGCLVEVAETLILTLVIFFVIQNFIAQPYQVQQKSMERTLEPGQYVLVDKLTPRWDSYSRGDVIVFNPPPAWTQDPTPYIKRVIGLPGDTVRSGTTASSTSTARRSTSRTRTRTARACTSRRPRPATSELGRAGGRAVRDGRPPARSRPTRASSARSPNRP